MIEIDLLKKWVREKKIKFYVEDAKIYCVDTQNHMQTGESVIVGEVDKLIHALQEKA